MAQRTTETSARPHSRNSSPKKSQRSGTSVMIPAGNPFPMITRPIESYKQPPFVQLHGPTASTNLSANSNISDKILSVDSYPNSTPHTDCKATREPKNTVKYYNRYNSIATSAHVNLTHPSPPLLRSLYLPRNSTFNFLTCSPHYNPVMYNLPHVQMLNV